MEKVVTHLLRGGVTPAQIGVITPYEGQRAHVLSTLTRSGPLSATLYSEARACCCPFFPLACEKKTRVRRQRLRYYF